jgi:hypothetical protein
MSRINCVDSKKLVFLVALLVTLGGCGTAHVRTDEQSADLHDYNNIFIDVVDVHSQEASAESNEALQTKMIEWEAFAREELEGYVNESHYQLLRSLPESPDSTLVVSLDIDLVYGNRAARYWGGFGAGKGSVDSVLTATDSATGDTKFKAVAESDLAMGAFGGDMQSVLQSNIRKLVDQYPKRSNED